MNKNNIVYGIVEETYILGNERRVAYGIAAYSNADEDGTATVVASVNDISSERDKIQSFVKLCNELELELVHLNDVVEDFLL